MRRKCCEIERFRGRDVVYQERQFSGELAVRGRMSWWWMAVAGYKTNKINGVEFDSFPIVDAWCCAGTIRCVELAEGRRCRGSSNAVRGLYGHNIYI